MNRITEIINIKQKDIIYGSYFRFVVKIENKSLYGDVETHFNLEDKFIGRDTTFKSVEAMHMWALKVKDLTEKEEEDLFRTAYKYFGIFS